MVIVAHIHDSKAAFLLMRVLNDLFSSIKVIIPDGEYRGEIARQIQDAFGYGLKVVISGYGKQGFISA